MDENADPRQPGPQPTDRADGPIAQVVRVAAYAVVQAEGRVLLSQMALRTPVPGLWALPGGGLEYGETPVQAVAREVLEETGHTLTNIVLLDVGSDRFTGRSPAGRLEDFQSIQIVYSADVVQVLEPRVLEVDGSTARAAWVPWAQVPDLPMVASFRRWLGGPASDPQGRSSGPGRGSST